VIVEKDLVDEICGIVAPDVVFDEPKKSKSWYQNNVTNYYAKSIDLGTAWGKNVSVSEYLEAPQSKTYVTYEVGAVYQLSGMYNGAHISGGVKCVGVGQFEIVEMNLTYNGTEEK
jgi:cytolysin (calcineurin-like family phosphatase)